MTPTLLILANAADLAERTARYAAALAAPLHPRLALLHLDDYPVLLEPELAAVALAQAARHAAETMTGLRELAARLPAPDATPFPSLPLARPFRTVTYTQPAELSAYDTAFAAGVKPLVQADRNSEAEDRWRAASNTLSNGVRTEWAQRIGWSYYSANDNAAALQLGIEAAKGADKAAIEAAALACDKVARTLAGTVPKKIIVVPDRLVNIVV